MIMRDVLIALAPASLFGVVHFGAHALLVIIATVAAAVLTEYIYEKLMKLPVTIGDLSAAVTGLILALNMPPEIPLWMPMLGAVFAILFVKLLFGGLGQNFMNPALAGRCFLLISFAGSMNKFTLDGITTATPLAALKDGETVDVMASFLGKIPGTIGEVSALCVLIGAAYLLIRKIISIRIPGTYILSFLVFMIIFSGRGFSLQYLLGELFSGGLMIGAFFMATDYVTSPITPKGQILFGICLGVLTGLFRLFGNSAEGVSYAIIFCNLLVPLIEKITMPETFGKEKKSGLPGEDKADKKPVKEQKEAKA